MSDTIGMGLHDAAHVMRLGWYLSLNRLVGWQTDRLGLRPRYKTERPSPSQTEILADLRRLLRRDADAVRDGILPPLNDGVGPVEALRRARNMLADLPAALRRRAEEDAGSVRETAAIEGLPAYYTQDFHYQTGGYLSDLSARLYDIQVETLFLGGAAPMRREALRPIAEFMRGRDQRRMSLVDVACGTGRFLRDVRRAWPALGLIGIDLSQSYIEEARRHLRGLRPANLVTSNAEAIPLADQSQDLATCIFLFHELPPDARRRITAEMARILKPGGLLVLVDSLQMGDRPDWDGLLESFPARFHEPYFESYATENIGAILTDSGLELRQTWTSFLAKIIVAQKPSGARATD